MHWLSVGLDAFVVDDQVVLTNRDIDTRPFPLSQLSNTKRSTP
jgi:hypothetical protein